MPSIKWLLSNYELKCPCLEHFHFLIDTRGYLYWYFWQLSPKKHCKRVSRMRRSSWTRTWQLVSSASGRSTSRPPQLITFLDLGLGASPRMRVLFKRSHTWINGVLQQRGIVIQSVLPANITFTPSSIVCKRDQTWVNLLKSQELIQPQLTF